MKYLLILTCNKILIVCFQSADYWVRVHSLKSLNDGGILDFDDRLSDVTDDREQVITQFAVYSHPNLAVLVNFTRTEQKLTPTLFICL